MCVFCRVVVGILCGTCCVLTPVFAQYIYWHTEHREWLKSGEDSTGVNGFFFLPTIALMGTLGFLAFFLIFGKPDNNSRR